ncbi:MAG: lysophospholipid acyltransferase family protein [Candidatus Competibacteraceae bacterium]|nr:lysophospholipid acyltransferase family protein [Candidatus Competibacteraceae bacterium]
MKDFFSYLSIFCIRLIAFLPNRLLRVMGHVLGYLLFRLAKYRRTVVTDNLQHAFPDFSAAQIQHLASQYYRHLGGLLAETVMGLRIPPDKCASYCTMDSSLTGLFHQFFLSNQHFIVLMGHTGNWEWSGLATPAQVQHRVVALYRPIKNKVFDRFMFRYRTRTGMHLLPMHGIARAILQHDNRPTCFTFIADQSPIPQHAVWLSFMGRDTPFFQGFEMLARRYQLPVVYVSQIKRKEGGYQLKGEVISMHPHLEHEHFIVQSFASLLERDIRLQPAYWLWSHKRWKHSRTA